MPLEGTSNGVATASCPVRLVAPPCEARRARDTAIRSVDFVWVTVIEFRRVEGCDVYNVAR